MDATHPLSPSMLAAWLDGELDLTATLAIERHLAACPACAQALEQQSAAQQQVRQAIADEATRYVAPSHLKQRIGAALRAEATAAAANGTAAATANAPSAAEAEAEAEPASPPTQAAPVATPAAASGQRRHWRAWLATRPWAWINLGLATAAGAAFAVTLALYLELPSAGQQSDDLLQQELVASHFRSLMPDRLADVISTDQHTVKPWFAGKLDFSPPVVDLVPQGYALVGGRLDYVDRRPVAALAYRHRRHVINLYLWPEDGGDIGAPAATRQGFHLLHWRQDGMRYYAISDLGATELADFASQLRARTVR